MKNTIRVTVTQDHIDRGSMGSPTHCPIALALKGNGHRNASVGYHTVCLGCFDVELYELSKPAIAFASRFDQGEQVKPRTFVLSLPKIYRT